MDTNELRSLQEAYLEVVENQQLDEISQKTATRAYAASKTGEYEGKDSPRDVKRSDNLKRQIKRKFGDKAAKHANRAAHARTFGRKGFGGMPPKPTNEEVDLYDIILSHLLDEGYAETPEAARSIMVNMSEEWRDSIVKEFLDEAEKPFPHEKVKAKQVALRDKEGGKALDRRMKMGLAARRAKEAEKTGGSQQDAGKDWYHGR